MTRPLGLTATFARPRRLGCVASNVDSAVRLARVAITAAAVACGLIAVQHVAPAVAASSTHTYSPRFASLPGSAASVLAVGGRYVVYGNPHVRTAPVYVADTKKRRARRVELPEGCGASYASSSSDVFLVQCVDGARVIDPATGEVRYSVSGNDDWSDLGAKWLRSYVAHKYLNWHTGEVRTRDSSALPDLDSPGLAPLSICSPFAAQTQSGRNSQAQQSDGWTLFARGRPAKLYVGRCGVDSPPRFITSENHYGRHIAETGSAVGGWTAWLEAPRRCRHALYTYDFSSRKRFRWTSTGVPIASCVAVLVQTRYAIVTGRVTAKNSDGSDIYSLAQLRIAKRPS